MSIRMNLLVETFFAMGCDYYLHSAIHNTTLLCQMHLLFLKETKQNCTRKSSRQILLIFLSEVEKTIFALDASLVGMAIGHIPIAGHGHEYRYLGIQRVRIYFCL